MSRPPELSVSLAHRPECRFGTGFYRVVLDDGGMRYVQNETEVQTVRALLPEGSIASVQRDGYCLDGDQQGDARTPDVVDAEWWLNLPREVGMAELGLDSEADYRRAYSAIEQAVYRRDNRAAQGGVRATIVIKRRGRKVTDVA